VAGHRVVQLSPLPQSPGPGVLDAGGRMGRSFAPERQMESVSLFGALADHIRSLRGDAQVVIASWSEGARERLRGLEDAVQRAVITAPDNGKVLALSVHAPGEVVRPGAHLLDIVPVEQSLIVEARLSPQDVDQVRVGQMAEVRFSAFRQRDMPRVEGQLVALSADRLVDEINGSQQPYYLARIRVAEKGMADLAKLKLELMPGMPADVLVTTGQRTLWHYLTAPLSDMMVRSLKEE
jgi:epimerase transport system membrane fusion protein